MPFKSDKQRRYLFSQKPEVAAKFVKDEKQTKKKKAGLKYNRVYSGK